MTQILKFLYNHPNTRGCNAAVASCPFLLNVIWSFFKDREGGSHLLVVDCPVIQDPSPRSPLERSPNSPSWLFVSQLDWQVQSNHSVHWGPKLTPVTHPSQHNGSVPPAWPASLCPYWITAQAGTVHSRSNWKHVIDLKKKGKNVRHWPWLHPTGQMEPVKDNIGMRHPHYEDLSVPFVGGRTRAAIFEASGGIVLTS